MSVIRARVCVVAEPMWGTTRTFGRVEQRVVGGQRLGVGDVEGGGGDLAVVQRGRQRGLVDERRRARC